MNKPQHLTRSGNDPLGQILEAWGLHQAKRVPGLSLSIQSPIGAINAPETGRTDKLDRGRYRKIRESLKPYYSGASLNHAAMVAYSEWKGRISTMTVRETISFTPITPIYRASRYWSEIDQIIGQLPPKQKEALIVRYVQGVRNTDKNFRYIANLISKAKKELKENDHIQKIIRDWS